MLEMLEGTDIPNSEFEMSGENSESVEELKKSLWSLCYEPADFLARRNYEANIDTVRFQEELLKICSKKYENFIFGSKEPKMYTYGIDLKISNPIIRDTVIERCEKISNDPEFLRTCISHICTRRDSFEYEERRRHAFDLLDFSEKEQEFLEKTIDTYWIGELLKAIQKEKYPNEFFKKRLENKKNQFEGGKATDESSKLDSTALIQNKEEVQQFLLCYNGTEFVNPILLLKNLDSVTLLIEKAKALKDKGIDPSRVGQKADAVGKLYASLESL